MRLCTCMWCNACCAMQVVHGADDALCQPSGSEEFVSTAASQDKTLRLYEGEKHLLFYGKPETREQVVKEVSAWIVQHV